MNVLEHVAGLYGIPLVLHVGADTARGEHWNEK
jgi:hypothetical protein